MICVHAIGLIPSTSKAVRSFTTRFGETWFAVYVIGEADGLLSVHPTLLEAEAEIARSVDRR